MPREPRRPQETLLHRLVRAHLATFLAHVREHYDSPLPRYVTDAFERYLACGDFAEGFVRCRCDTCGHDVLVSFSCKARGLCPSCGARRMCDEAAHLTDRVFPSVPLRQWVLSLPFELRGLAATKPDVLTALGRIFAEEIARATRRAAGIPGAETGAVTFPQRFGGSLNLHLHFHTLAVDGVFEKRGNGVVLHETPPPTKESLDELARRVRDRAIRWLRRKGYLDERPAEDRGNDTDTPTALDACTQLALARGAFLARPFAPRDARDDADFDRKDRRFSASLDGFDVHCAVRIAAQDDEGRERLVRYCARHPFALDRFELLPDGRVAYLMKTPRNGRTHRVLDGIELLARLSALIPPPRYPTVRYHGVFAPGSSWRKLVTPKPPASREKTSCADKAADPPAPSPPSTAHLAPVVEAGPTTITVKHWGRLLDGELLAPGPRVDWATLLKRTFGFDALECPRCTKRMRVLAAITDRATARAILVHLGLPTDPPARAPPREPAWVQQGFGAA